MKWTSVKDALPNKYERVLVTDGKIVCFHYKQSCWNWEDAPGEDLYPIDQVKNPKGEWENCCEIEEGKITHWAYLPKITEE